MFCCGPLAWLSADASLLAIGARMAENGGLKETPADRSATGVSWPSPSPKSELDSGVTIDVPIFQHMEDRIDLRLRLSTAC
jgi:hypothetical protein